MMKTGPNDRKTVVWTFGKFFFFSFCSFYILTLNFILIRPYSDYIRYVRAGDDENGSKRPFRSHLDLSRLGEFFFFSFCSFCILTLKFIVIRPYSYYIRYIRAGDDENGSKRPQNGRLDLW